MRAPDDAVTVTVATTVAFEIAFDRAQLDPTRGISKEHGFLSRIYRPWADELVRIDPDLVIDTSQCTVEESVERIGAMIGEARRKRAELSPTP